MDARSEPKRKQWWRERADPLANVWPMLLGWLEEQPDLEAKAMLKALQASGHGHFPDGQREFKPLQISAFGSQGGGPSHMLMGLPLLTHMRAFWEWRIQSGALAIILSVALRFPSLAC